MNNYERAWTEEKKCREEIAVEYNKLKDQHQTDLSKYKANREELKRKNKQYIQLLQDKEELETKLQTLQQDYDSLTKGSINPKGGFSKADEARLLAHPLVTKLKGLVEELKAKLDTQQHRIEQIIKVDQARHNSTNTNTANSKAQEADQRAAALQGRQLSSQYQTTNHPSFSSTSSSSNSSSSSSQSQHIHLQNNRAHGSHGHGGNYNPNSSAVPNSSSSYHPRRPSTPPPPTASQLYPNPSHAPHARPGGGGGSRPQSHVQQGGPGPGPNGPGVRNYHPHNPPPPSHPHPHPRPHPASTHSHNPPNHPSHPHHHGHGAQGQGPPQGPPGSFHQPRGHGPPGHHVNMQHHNHNRPPPPQNQHQHQPQFGHGREMSTGPPGPSNAHMNPSGYQSFIMNPRKRSAPMNQNTHMNIPPNKMNRR